MVDNKKELFHIQYQAFQVFAFGVVDVDGVVGWLMQLMQDAHIAACVGSSGEYGSSELVFGHYL